MIAFCLRHVIKAPLDQECVPCFNTQLLVCVCVCVCACVCVCVCVCIHKGVRSSLICTSAQQPSQHLYTQPHTVQEATAPEAVWKEAVSRLVCIYNHVTGVQVGSCECACSKIFVFFFPMINNNYWSQLGGCVNNIYIYHLKLTSVYTWTAIVV